MKSTRMRTVFSLFAATLFALACVTSCKNSKFKRTFTRPDTLCVDSANFCRADSTDKRCIAVDIHADYPTPITGKLSANIAAWIRSKLGKGTPADTMNVDNVVSYYGNMKYNSFVANRDSARFHTIKPIAEWT